MAEANSFIRPDALWRLLGLRAEQVVVHLGCGAGFYLIPAADIVGPKGKVIGVDIRPDILAEVENKARRHKVDKIVSTLRANVENTPGTSLEEKSADPVHVLQEAKRIVSQNGTVVAVEWNTSATPFGPPVAKRISTETLQGVASSVGLNLVKEFIPSPYHFGLVYTR
jgi:ubiquinone/menaquinone biosynthesis C-methylase UbiE